MGQPELGGLLDDLTPATRDLAEVTDESLDLLPQTDLLSKCARDNLLPTGNVVIRDEFQTGRENYKDFFYALVGLAGEGQNLDGNGQYVRFQTGGGAQQLSFAPGDKGFPPQFGALPTPPLGNRPAMPSRQAAVRRQQALLQADAAGPQRPGRAQDRADQRRRLDHRGEGHGAAARGLPGDREGRRMTAIRKHARDVAAIIALIVIAFAVASVILANQRLALPGWVPFLGQDFTEVEAELSSAQAVTPGQGQTVNVAGVEVGEISAVRLENGRAIVTLKLKEDSVPVYRDASVLLRPKTGLKDMVAELTPGTRAAGELPPGERIPIGQTAPDVNLDEILASLDDDTRTYLQLLLSEGGQALGGNSRALANTIRRFEPTARYTEQIAGKLAERRRNIRRVIHNFSLVVEELGGRDDQLADFVSSSNAVFASLASQDASLRATLQELPSTLTATQSALTDTTALADVLGPTLQALRPGARALGPALAETQPFLTDTTPVIRDEIRPFVRASRPAGRALKPAASDLAALTPNLTRTFTVLNELVDLLAHNPSGKNDEGYLFWLSWLNHLGPAVFANQDAQGPIRRGVVIISCESLQLLENVVLGNPQLGVLVELLEAPERLEVCPSALGVSGQGAGG